MKKTLILACAVLLATFTANQQATAAAAVSVTGLSVTTDGDNALVIVKKSNIKRSKARNPKRKITMRKKAHKVPTW